MGNKRGLGSSTHSTKPSGGMGTRRPTAPPAEFLHGEGERLRPKARSGDTGSLGRSPEGGAGALHRDQNKGGDHMAERVILRAEEVSEILGIGRTKLYS